ncbi:VOC family protein [Kribbella sp. NBC_01505]|uniref:VOC family protein n=1 Tax=Kribbella sp. NBC_01505 TaxID=2903580 RepID=UPI0038657DAE
MRAALDGIFGVKLPVSDLAAARGWYERVFELTPMYEFPDEGGVVRGVAYQAAGLGNSGLALRERPDVAGLSGFDPVSFGIKDKAAADAWGAHLTELGIEHQILLATIGWIVIFHDPDGLEIHLYSREKHGEDMSSTPGRGQAV